MDIFAKCYEPSLAGELKEKGVYPYFHALQSRQDVEVMMEGKRRIMLGSNNYLGLTTDPEVVEAGIRALEQYGTGCSGSRFLNGTLQMHLELEEELGRFLRKPGIVTFGTGFQSNVGIISALVGRHDYVICDRENHASIYAGCQLSYGKMLRYRHSDMAELEKCLQKVPETAGALIVTDGVFSMGGDMAASAEVAEYVRHTSRPFIFSASIPPANCATALAALRKLEQHPELPERLRQLSRYARDGLTARGLTIRPSALEAPTPIIPIYTYETYRTLRVAAEIYDRGVYVNPTLPPATPEGEALLRTSYMATHTEALLDEAMDIIGEVMAHE